MTDKAETRLPLHMVIPASEQAGEGELPSHLRLGIISFDI